MNLVSTALLAFAMSTDAFAAAIGKGASLHKPRLSEALRTGLIFGVIETITPVIGWVLGLAAARYVVAWDHWIAFTLLAGLGAMMIRNGLRKTGDAEHAENAPRRHSFWLLALTAVATSIDAMAVGVGLAFIDVDILPTAAAIGLATMHGDRRRHAGSLLGAMAGRRAEILGGVLLIAIGSFILHEHLSV